MEPYRPLYVLRPAQERSPHELRGIAVLVVFLGVLRLGPALLRGEGANTETMVAIAMLILGGGILLRMKLRSGRCP